MSEQQIEGTRKRNLLRRVRRQRLKYITILPSLITLLNGIFGFAAIGFASKGAENFSFHKLELPYFAWSAYMIFIAMIADMLDGRVARMSQTTSSFGGQLDSLCDMISFGVAPAFLMLKVLDNKLTQLVAPTPLLSDFLVRFIWLAAAVYMACAAIRLARFNVENEEDETKHMSFMGLPTPAAAGVLASLVVFYQYILQSRNMLAETAKNTWLFTVVENTVIYSLSFVTIGVAILMISRIRYPHVVNLFLKGRKPITHLLWSVGILGLIFLVELPPALLIAFCGFALSGFTRHVYFRIVMARNVPGEVDEPPVLTITNPPSPIDS